MFDVKEYTKQYYIDNKDKYKEWKENNPALEAKENIKKSNKN